MTQKHRLPTSITVCFLVLTLAFSVFSSESQPGNTSIESFSKAKKFLHNVVYSGHRTTLYCECSYNEKKEVDWSSCGYSPQKANRRAKRVEWEHVVPAHAFGQSFKEWRDGHPECKTRKGKSFKGRKCAGKMNLDFRRMEADLYNLSPAIGEVNGLRSNYSMAMIPGEKRKFGACDVEIEGRKVEPRPEIRGDIARIYLYMDSAYPGRGIISQKNRKLFEAWRKSDPVDAWECERSRKIAKIQGNVNRIVKLACEANGL